MLGGVLCLWQHANQEKEDGKQTERYFERTTKMLDQDCLAVLWSICVDVDGDMFLHHLRREFGMRHRTASSYENANPYEPPYYYPKREEEDEDELECSVDLSDSDIDCLERDLCNSECGSEGSSKPEPQVKL